MSNWLVMKLALAGPISDADLEALDRRMLEEFGRDYLPPPGDGWMSRHIRRRGELELHVPLLAPDRPAGWEAADIVCGWFARSLPGCRPFVASDNSLHPIDGIYPDLPACVSADDPGWDFRWVRWLDDDRAASSPG